jgi:uncharacterized RDD family membrane protein YckC
MDRPLCTVLIPFDAAGRARFEILQQIGQELGFETMRVAQYYSSGMILEEVVRSIRDAHLVIADLTGCNPNVCYELGIAHALGKRVWLVSEDPQACPIHFGELEVCEFAATPEGRTRLAEALRTVVNTPGTLSPIQFFTGGLAVAGQPLTARRLGAFLLDVLFALPVVGVLMWATRLLLPAAPAEVVEVAITPGLLAYFLVASVALGTTPGQRILRLQVTRLDRRTPSIWQRLLRPITSLLIVFTLGIGFFWAARSPRHQAPHDMITRTLVLRRATQTGAG